MSRSSRRNLAVVVPLWASVARAISLSDFTPALVNVPDPCSSVYMQNIDGCTSADFPSSCSQSCISGLVLINRAVNAACSDFAAPSGSLISFFQAGRGIQALCNVVVITAGASSTPVIGSSTMVLPSTATGATSSTLLVDTSSAPNPQSPRPSTQPQQSSNTGIMTATGSPSLPSTLPTPTPSSSKPPAAVSQSSGNDGTGGDPFSITDSNSAASVNTASLSIIVTLALTAVSIFVF